MPRGGARPGAGRKSNAYLHYEAGVVPTLALLQMAMARLRLLLRDAKRDVSLGQLRRRCSTATKRRTRRIVSRFGLLAQTENGPAAQDDRAA
jgi:hypothetical protein